MRGLVKLLSIMKKIPLLPGYFTWVGCVLIACSLGIYFNDLFSLTPYRFDEISLRTFVIADDTPFNVGGTVYLGISNVNLGFSLIVLSALLGLCGIAFSRKPVEDEFINSLRLFAWSWSVILSIAYGVLANLFVFGMHYLILVVLFPHFLLVLFIVIFNMQWRRFTKGAGQ